MKENKLNTIAFPSIGTGRLGYPSNLFVKWSLNSAIYFLHKNLDQSYHIKFVIYEKDEKIIQVSDLAFCFIK